MKRSAADPFLEHLTTPFSKLLRVINTPVLVESNRRWLLELAHQAFDDYGVGEMGATDPLRLRLIANNDLPANAINHPPPVQVWSDGDLLMASMSPVDMGVCSFKARRAMITISPAMAQFGHSVRYELIEFLLYQLVRRTLHAVGLHAACLAYTVGGNADNRSCLLFGESGSGKSTLAYACLTRGWRFLSEDGAFVLTSGRVNSPGNVPANAVIRGMPNFIHLTEESRAFFPEAYAAPGAIWITRRSGRKKLEIDVRRAFSSAPLGETALGYLIFLTRQRGVCPALKPMAVAQTKQRLMALQPFAAAQDHWPEVLACLLARPAFLLDTGSDPHAAAALLETLIE